ncbi:hypothetical protein E9229_003353 [Paeniglutamicibacter cryotolerans]|uniref:Uncharacterized protein n=1 Tax=Paeniglutamicibacter cryotolerans TaxID=670079 RepID=A0A839QT11_9MICC|nr:hypothetical protein [Paeniglutamicibacter cryotolerans]
MRQGLWRHPIPRLLPGQAIGILKESISKRGRVVAHHAHCSVPVLSNGNRVLITAHDHRLGLADLRQVRRHEEQVFNRTVSSGFGDHRTPIRVANDDRGIRLVEFSPKGFSVCHQSTAGLLRRSFPAGRQGNGSATDASCFAQQLGRPLPPPAPVTNQGSVYEDQLHGRLLHD